MRYLLAIFLAVVVSVAYSQTEPKTKSKEGDNKTEQDKRGAKDQPLVKEDIPSIPTKAEAEEKQNHHSDNLQVASRISADIKGLHKEAKINTILTGVLIVIAFFQAIFFVFQLKYMRQATIDSGKSAKAAKASADAATKTMETMRDAEAPYLFPKIVRYFLRNDSVPTLVYEFTNYGKTPAVLNRFQDFVTCDPLPDAPTFPEPMEARPEREVVIPQNGSGTKIYVRLDGGDLYEGFCKKADEGKPLHVIGRVEYEDIFGRSYVKHFCMRVAPNAARNDVRIWVAGGKPYNRLDKDV